MDEYTLLLSLIKRLSKSDAFSKETLSKLSLELEEASNDGRLDTEKNYDVEQLFEELMLCSSEILERELFWVR